MGPPQLKFDQIGYWSQLKLDIVKEYATTYSKILTKQPRLRHVYIDAFAGAGIHQLKTTGELVPGSPLNALAVQPAFSELHLVDLDGAKVESLRRLTAGRENVFIYHGDCNRILIDEIFPRVRYEDFKRALCLLDPYGLTLSWEVISKAASMKTVEIFLNFPIMDMNRNALWSNLSGVAQADVDRMNAYWGDDSWRHLLYRQQRTLFGDQELLKAGGNRKVVAGFRDRLRQVAGFELVPEPIPMRNAKNATVYYLFFASHNETGAKIARHLMRRYQNHGGR